MAIGDEKVVAEVGTVFDLRWIGSGPLAYLVNRHGVKVGDKLVPLKAYAELAAELEREKMISANRFLLVTIVEKKLQAAESQLAELRGKCERLVDRWANDSNYSFYECEHDLRTLAAGGGAMLTNPHTGDAPRLPGRGNRPRWHPDS